MALIGKSTIKIFGIEGPNSCLNGRYDPVPEEVNCGVSVYRFRGCPDIWLEFGGGGKMCWQIKSTRERGTGIAWASSAELTTICTPDKIPKHKHFSYMIPDPVCTWSVAHSSGERYVDAELQINECDSSSFLTDMFESEALKEGDKNFIFSQMANIVSNFGKDLVGKDVLRLHGMLEGPMEALNGHYAPTEEMHGGVSVYQKTDNPDIWLEFGGGGKNSWQLKGTSGKGTAANWAYVDVARVCLPQHVPTRTQLYIGQVSDWKVAKGDGTFEDKWICIDPADPTADIITEFVIEKLKGEAEGMLESFVLKQIVLAVFTGGAGNVALQAYEASKIAMYVINLTKLVAERQTAEGKIEITKALLDELWSIVFA